MMIKKVKIHVVDLKQWPEDDDDTRAKPMAMRRTRNMRTRTITMIK